MSKKIRRNKKKKRKGGTSRSPESKKIAPQGTTLSIEQAYQLALQNFQSGNPVQAERLCLQILQIDSGNADANHLLGIMASSVGNKGAAIELLSKAIQSDPDNAQIHKNLGLIFNESGRPDEAIKCFRAAIALNPDYAVAYNDLGVVLKNTGELEEAIACFRKALSINPGFADAHNNMGNAFLDSGRIEEAIDSFREALSLKPDFAMAHYNLGTAYHKSHRIDEAVACYRKSLSLNSHNADAYIALGLIYSDTGMLDEAIASIEKAVSLNPSFAEAYDNLGMLFIEQGKMNEAVANFRKAITLDSDNAEAYSHLGFSLKELGQLEEAIVSFKKAISIKPLLHETHNFLGLVYLGLNKFLFAESSFREALAINPEYAEAYNNLGLVFSDTGMLDEAISYLREALLIKDYSMAHSNLLLFMNYHRQITQQEISEESLNFAKIYETKEAGYSHLSAARDLSARKLRIGYISPDFCIHSVSFFIKPLLEAHNREKFEIYCYSDVKNPDIVSGQIEAATDHWVSIAKKNDEEAFARINEDRIDILVDLAGHTRNNRLPMFARKPAPIQVSWLGYPNTTGLQTMDYRFTDLITDPVGEDDNLYTEELIRLKDCFLCYKPYDHSPEVVAPPFVGSNIITFGSFNNLVKINSDVIKVWSRILLEVPGSRLVLKTRQFAAEHVREKYRAKFAEEGISSDRLELKDFIPNINDHLSLYNEVDIALDPFPYNGTTTTCEALWMGVPVVALEGDRHGGRVGASILHAIGLAETLVADSSESYIERAVSLAGEKELLIGLRENLRQQMQASPLCDANSFAKKIEEAYQGMWAKYLESHVKENSQK